VISCIPFSINHCLKNNNKKKEKKETKDQNEDQPIIIELLVKYKNNLRSKLHNVYYKNLKHLISKNEINKTK